MRGLDDEEFYILDRAVRRLDGESVPWVGGVPGTNAAKASLAARGLAVLDVPVDGFDKPGARPTPLGRIALRVERLIRSGAALKGVT